MEGAEPPTWDMVEEEHEFLFALPEIVELWRVRPLDSDYGSTFYLSEDRGIDGMRACSHCCVGGVLERVAIRHEYVVAVDLDRGTAQVMLVEVPAPEPVLV